MVFLKKGIQLRRSYVRLHYKSHDPFRSYVGMTTESTKKQGRMFSQYIFCPKSKSVSCRLLVSDQGRNTFSLDQLTVKRGSHPSLPLPFHYSVRIVCRVRLVS